MEKLTISAAQLKDKIEQGEKVYILDVRDPDKYQTGSFEHMEVVAENIPYATMISDDTNVKSDLDQLPIGVQIVTVCTTGNKAQKAATLLSEKGYSAVSLQGGLTAWREE